MQGSGPIVADGKVISGRSCLPRGGPDACVVTAHDGGFRIGAIRVQRFANDQRGRLPFLDQCAYSFAVDAGIAIADDTERAGGAGDVLADRDADAAVSEVEGENGARQTSGAPGVGSDAADVDAEDFGGCRPATCERHVEHDIGPGRHIEP